jgi:hypothetical protein
MLKKLGNLVLLEKIINCSISDDVYESKKKGYRESRILLTRSLVEKPQVGKNTYLERTMKALNINTFELWNSSAIDKRQNFLATLARQVWNLNV